MVKATPNFYPFYTNSLFKTIHCTRINQSSFLPFQIVFFYSVLTVSGEFQHGQVVVLCIQTTFSWGIYWERAVWICYASGAGGEQGGGFKFLKRKAQAKLWAIQVSKLAEMKRNLQQTFNTTELCSHSKPFHLDKTAHTDCHRAEKQLNHSSVDCFECENQQFISCIIYGLWWKIKSADMGNKTNFLRPSHIYIQVF